MSRSDVHWCPPASLMRVLAVVALVGGLLFVLGLFVAAERVWGGYLMGFFLFVGLALAGGLFLSVLTLANARWATALRSIPEAMMSTLPAAGVLGLLLVFGIHSLYEWSHGAYVAGDALLLGKSGYLNQTFFILRLVAFFALWIWATRGMINASRPGESVSTVNPRRRRLRYAIFFLPMFAITFSLASVDWIQSLEPHWFSTIFGLVTLSGMGTSGLAVCIILAVHLGRGPLKGIVRKEHLDDLGKIGIGFALFWGYIWYCQYMLTWYTDMPEETPYYILRGQGNWRVLSMANVALNWAVPFFALMPKAARRSESVLLRVAWVMLVGQAVNLFMLVEPGLMGTVPSIGLWELAPVLGAFAFFLFLTLRRLGNTSLVPWKDPDFEESMHYHC